MLTWKSSRKHKFDGELISLTFIVTIKANINDNDVMPLAKLTIYQLNVACLNIVCLSFKLFRSSSLKISLEEVLEILFNLFPSPQNPS